MTGPAGPTLRPASQDVLGAGATALGPIAMRTGRPDQPKRIQRRRTPGWSMPDGAIYVGRPTQWGNPFRVGSSAGQLSVVHFSSTNPITADQARELYRLYVAERILPRWPDAEDIHRAWLAPLRGHDLACWCSLDQPCHADVLLEVANR